MSNPSTEAISSAVVPEAPAQVMARADEML
ncbi:MAG: hypothetical protein BWX47_00354 [candidate division Hyd24-12 bacterium ADurb.Bin004]|nr:MAG: hypothetical protein BWX47_00354 [candidate division Hyd24-12 bacterium ADurb.Bin004]